MSSRITYFVTVLFSFMITVFGSLSLYAVTPQLQIWTPHSNRPIYTTNLMNARQGLKELQDKLQTYRNGTGSASYVNGYFPMHMDSDHAMRNAKLFVEPSHWHAARQKIDELDNLLRLHSTQGVLQAVDSISYLLEDGKRDIDQRLDCIAVHSKTSKQGRKSSTAIQSPDHLNQLHAVYQQHKAQRTQVATARNAVRNGAAQHVQQPENTAPAPAQDPQDEEAQLRQRFTSAGLSSAQVDELFALLEQFAASQTEENKDKLVTFVNNLPQAQKQAVLTILGPRLVELVQQSQGFIAMVKEHPWLTGISALVAGGFIVWALFNAKDLGTTFGGWIRSWLPWNKTNNDGTANQPQVNNPPQPNNQNPPVPNPADVRPNNNQQQQQQRENQQGRPVNGTEQQANGNGAAPVVIPGPQQQQAQPVVDQQVNGVLNAQAVGNQHVQIVDQQEGPALVIAVDDLHYDGRQDRQQVQQSQEHAEQLPSADNGVQNKPHEVVINIGQPQPKQQDIKQGIVTRLGGWFANKWQQAKTGAQNLITPAVDEAFALDKI